MMAATTLAVSNDLRRRLMKLKIEEGAKSMDELLNQILMDHRKYRFLEASALFRERLTEKGITFEDLVN